MGDISGWCADHGDVGRESIKAVSDRELRDSIERVVGWALMSRAGMRDDYSTRVRLAAFSLLNDSFRDLALDRLADVPEAPCDLSSAARALRIAAATAMRGELDELDELTRFLLGQQTADGSFGQFRAEVVEAMRQRLGADLCVNTDLRLPVALACGRAIAAVLRARARSRREGQVMMGSAPVARQAARGIF